MKKFFALLLAAIMLISLSACGGNSKSNEVFGTWVVDSIESDGSKFSIDEWKNLENDDLSKCFIVFKEGGKAYVYDGDYGNLCDWLQSENSIMIDGKKGEIFDGKICIDCYGDKLYLSKESNSQEIPNEEETSSEEKTTTKATTFASTTVPVKNESNSSDAEWKQFLKDYEAWVDSYIAIYNKYKANPTDQSILSDYTKMVGEMTEWSEKADDIEDELEDTDAALEYSAELMRIASKLANIA